MDKLAIAYMFRFFLGCFGLLIKTETFDRYMDFMSKDIDWICEWANFPRNHMWDKGE